MKKILAALIVTAFAFCVGTAFAKTVKCTIETVDRNKIWPLGCRFNNIYYIIKHQGFGSRRTEIGQDHMMDIVL